MQIADMQYNFLESEYNKLREQAKIAQKLADTSKIAVEFFGVKKSKEDLSLQEKYDRDYQLIDDKQKKFLEDSEISEDLILNTLRKFRMKKIKVLRLQKKKIYFVILRKLNFFKINK
jgi:hypothetical protein